MPSARRLLLIDSLGGLSGAALNALANDAYAAAMPAILSVQLAPVITVWGAAWIGLEAAVVAALAVVEWRVAAREPEA